MSALAGDRSMRIELVCFAALATLVALQWTSLVTDPPTVRATLAVLIATGAGAGLAAIPRVVRPRLARWGLAAAATFAALCLGMVLVGLPARLLLPGHWDELGDNLGRSLNGLADIPVPYEGADQWTRLVILLGGPLMVGLAAFAAFWPTRRRAAGKIWAVALLLALYLVAVAWARPGRQLAGGVLLVILICAWLWLPGVAARSRMAAGIAVAAAALVALPAASAIDSGRALIDYRHWDLFSAHGQSFRWDQSYGPLDWPQKGTLLLEVASEHSHYWKATNLDTFDGVRWLRSAGTSSEPALGQPLKFHPKGTPPRPDTEWVDRINLNSRRLSSDFAIGAGTVLALSRTEARPEPDAVWSMTEELRPGTTYTALVYDPKPSIAEMRAAGTAFPAEAERYVSFSLPGPSGPAEVQVPFWGRSGPASIAEQVRDTPYAEMYGLASSLVSDASTPYDAVQRIELHLRSTYAYRQNVPDRSYPLPAFLSEDRAGYCQQFSGTMALMLRMLGIPSRVSAGFAPGGRDPDRNNFLVDDTDAHNWVEVFFPRIGWVTFEPTPGDAPAATQLDDNALGVTKPEPSEDPAEAPTLPDQPGGELPENPPAVSGSPGPGGRDSGPGAATLLAGGPGAFILAAIAAYAARRLRRSRMDPEELAGAELRELDRALDRLGSPLSPGTTLLRAEETLARLAGAPAAGYAARLRDRRYRSPDTDPPGVADRRALRRGLISPDRGRSALRVLLAIPPGGPSPRTGRASPRTSR